MSCLGSRWILHARPETDPDGAGCSRSPPGSTKDLESLSARQVRRSHQEFVDGARALAAFADRPDHQRLAAAHVAGGKHLGHEVA